MAVKFVLSKKATKINEIFTIDLTLCSKCQIVGEDFVIFVAFLENMNFKKNAISLIAHPISKGLFLDFLKILEQPSRFKTMSQLLSRYIEGLKKYPLM